MSAPLILALDTSIGPCTVALARGKEVLAYERMDAFREQSSRLIGMIDDACKAANIIAQDLDAVACSLGPGSFTSLRVGLSAAKGLALAIHKPLIGVSTLRVMARG